MRLNINNVIRELRAKKMAMFSIEDFSRSFKLNPHKVSVFVSRNAKPERGNFIRLKNGLYTLKDSQPSPLEIANIIYRPSYISLDIALSYYNIIPEAVYSITSITARLSKRYKILNQAYEYHKIIKGLYFGYKTIKTGNKYIVIATREKALLDYLYFVAMGKKKYNDRFDFKNLDKKNFNNYSSRFFKSIKNENIRKNLGLLLKRIKL